MKEHEAEFRFYEELNDFLPLLHRKNTVCYAFNGHPGIKDSIEALGVPHTEVDLIVLTGGGSALFAPVVAELFDQAPLHIPADPVGANARGYFYYGGR